MLNFSDTVFTACFVKIRPWERVVTMGKRLILWKIPAMVVSELIYLRSITIVDVQDFLQLANRNLLFSRISPIVKFTV